MGRSGRTRGGMVMLLNNRIGVCKRGYVGKFKNYVRLSVRMERWSVASVYAPGMERTAEGDLGKSKSGVKKRGRINEEQW